MSPTIAVLALQGAFIEHEQRLQSLGCTTIELRQAADLARPFDGLVLPGGESTGRQLGSFHAEGRWEEGAKGTEEAAGATCVADAKDYSSNSATLASEPVPLTFIRAPRIEATGPGVEPLVTLNDAPVAVRHRNQIAAAFHPELDDDNRLYEALLAPLKRAY